MRDQGHREKMVRNRKLQASTKTTKRIDSKKTQKGKYRTAKYKNEKQIRQTENVQN